MLAPRGSRRQNEAVSQGQPWNRVLPRGRRGAPFWEWERPEGRRATVSLGSTGQNQLGWGPGPALAASEVSGALTAQASVCQSEKRVGKLPPFTVQAEYLACDGDPAREHVWGSPVQRRAPDDPSNAPSEKEVSKQENPLRVQRGCCCLWGGGGEGFK